ncbi:MAG: Conserved cytosolic protein [candidate division WWE3 bacterium GW2011_GWE1_41_27]|uniref:Conserved cytosolic protein n=2 Tax=Katanobacteria TaxID=422282 RepID=A0A0G1AEY8_UNCKA|nr:MAG: Conserved cytosolic protein [candidate division WWE3 bacterium GW2011_GWE1_41_27]KKS59524.1 MAG: Conserved cytosolic protein [candidate division WWE3 bacterium GW2011_GWF2_42_42]
MIYDNLKAMVFELQKSGDTFKLGVLRYFISQVQNKEIELRAQQKPLTDEDVFKVIRKQVKNRKEAAELFEKGGRADLVEKEKKELVVYEEFAKMFPFELEQPVNFPPQNKK